MVCSGDRMNSGEKHDPKRANHMPIKNTLGGVPVR